MWLKGVKTPVVLSRNCDERAKRACALSLFIATVKIMDFQMNVLSGPCRAKRVHPC